MSIDDIRLRQDGQGASSGRADEAMPERIIAGLEASSHLSAETGHPGQGIRPCLAALLETPLGRGDTPDRNSSAVALATELHRIGLDVDEITRRLEFWNQNNDPPLRPNQLGKAIRSGNSGKYNYGCDHLVLNAYCIGDESCPFRSRVKSRDGKIRNHVFLDYGWQRLLTNRQVLIYFAAIPYLEVKRQVGPGGVVCANHRQIADVCGVSEKRMGADLAVLRDVGLIEYKPGLPQKWLGVASQIRRAIPIPKPSPEALKTLRQQ
jgi:hypothetical protein